MFFFQLLFRLYVCRREVIIGQDQRDIYLLALNIEILILKSKNSVNAITHAGILCSYFGILCFVSVNANFSVCKCTKCFERMHGGGLLMFMQLIYL